MRKQEFIYQLWKKLSDLPKEEVEERLSFYGEMIDDRMEEGLSEEEAVAAIGSTDEIAEQIVGDIPVQKIIKEKTKPKKRLRVWEIVFLALGSPIWVPLLVIGPTVVFLSLYAVLWVSVVSLWAVFASFIGCAVGGIAGGFVFLIFGKPFVSMAMIGASLVCAGLSIFMFFGCKAATKGAVLLPYKTARAFKRLLIKKEEAV